MNTGSEKRKAAALSRIMEDRQVTLEEAIEIYNQRFRLMASKAGKKTGETKSRGDKSYYSKLAKLSWENRKK